MNQNKIGIDFLSMINISLSASADPDFSSIKDKILYEIDQPVEDKIFKKIYVYSFPSPDILFLPAINQLNGN